MEVSGAYPSETLLMMLTVAGEGDALSAVFLLKGIPEIKAMFCNQVRTFSRVENYDL
jgi:hypothetical protein